MLIVFLVLRMSCNNANKIKSSSTFEIQNRDVSRTRGARSKPIGIFLLAKSAALIGRVAAATAVFSLSTNRHAGSIKMEKGGCRSRSPRSGIGASRRKRVNQSEMKSRFMKIRDTQVVDS